MKVKCEHMVTVYKETNDGCLVVYCEDCNYREVCIPVEASEAENFGKNPS